MSRCSPGPWRRLPFKAGQAHTLIIVDANGDQVANVRGWAGDPDPAPANADLIAAAPELLVALHRIADPRMWRDGRPSGCDGDALWAGETPDGNEIDTGTPLSIARAAIAKATAGGTP